MTAIATTRRLASAALVAGVGSVALLAGGGAAHADQFQTIVLAPGGSTCVTQYAGFQVRADGTATGDGARFKLLRNGVVLDATPGRVNNWSAERRTAYGNFPGPGYYAACAYNTGTRNTTVFVHLLTDNEL